MLFSAERFYGMRFEIDYGLEFNERKQQINALTFIFG